MGTLHPLLHIMNWGIQRHEGVSVHSMDHTKKGLHSGGVAQSVLLSSGCFGCQWDFEGKGRPCGPGGPSHWKWPGCLGKTEVSFLLSIMLCHRVWRHFSLCLHLLVLSALLLPASRVLKALPLAIRALQLGVFHWAGAGDKEEMTVKPGAVACYRQVTLAQKICINVYPNLGAQVFP